MTEKEILRRVLEEVQKIINDSPSVIDTIWYNGLVTLHDHIDDVLADTEPDGNCKYCGGTGCKACDARESDTKDTGGEKCPECNGHGYLLITPSGELASKPDRKCSICHGTGRLSPKEQDDLCEWTFHRDSGGFKTSCGLFTHHTIQGECHKCHKPVRLISIEQDDEAITEAHGG